MKDRCPRCFALNGTKPAGCADPRCALRADVRDEREMDTYYWCRETEHLCEVLQREREDFTVAQLEEVKALGQKLILLADGAEEICPNRNMVTQETANA